MLYSAPLRPRSTHANLPGRSDMSMTLRRRLLREVEVSSLIRGVGAGVMLGAYFASELTISTAEAIGIGALCLLIGHLLPKRFLPAS